MNKGENKKKAEPKYFPTAIGIGLLLLIVVLTFSVKHFTGEQFLFLRMTLPIALAAIAVIIPGYVQIAYKGVIRMFGPMAIFGITYFYNPVGIEPFEYTIQLQRTTGVNTSNEYPNVLNSRIRILLGNDWKSTTVSENQVADFKNIPYNFKGKSVTVELDNLHWQLATHSILLFENAGTLDITPSSRLQLIKGIVKNSSNQILKNIEIQLLGRSYKTNEKGIFEISVPQESQKLEHEALFFKSGKSIRFTLKATNNELDNEITL